MQGASHDIESGLRGVITQYLARAAVRTLAGEYAEEGGESGEGPQVLGKGAFSTVVAARHRSSGRMCAVKQVNLSEVLAARRTGVLRAVLMEAGVLGQFAHPAIVGLLDVVIEPTRACVVMECCSGGTLLDVVQREVDRKRRLAAARAAAGRLQAAAAPAARSTSRTRASSCGG